MKDRFLLNYRVSGIKNLTDEVSLSFYKKTITAPIHTEEYNIKGIYGINGSGKSAILESVNIMRNLMTDVNYLNNPIVQENLNEIINKRTSKLSISADFLVKDSQNIYLFRYNINLIKNAVGRYIIDEEKLLYKKATSRKEELDILIHIKDGEVVEIYKEEDTDLKKYFIKKTMNLLSNSSSLILYSEVMSNSDEFKTRRVSFLGMCLWALRIVAENIYIYMDQSDNHINYFLGDILLGEKELDFTTIINQAKRLNANRLNIFHTNFDTVEKNAYSKYESIVKRLCNFIKIFKPELSGIDIDRKENGDMYVCSLNMVYDNYSISTEFESTGIKKLIKLFIYLDIMTKGGIVFIDELDSNLHDVYLCALLEYLMDFGRGQLCFTTHNVGPMDILKKHKKSIDFLSVDNKIYSWTSNGNYSPSKLYRTGMIEGSPFNIDSIDFIGIFDTDEED
ncbi:MAG: hypothetical protein E6040_02340 [Lachnospiraceae bacterium]|nr:hypothetical protein [Lachnospiraceae bacterium]